MIGASHRATLPLPDYIMNKVYLITTHTNNINIVQNIIAIIMIIIVIISGS